MRDGEHLLVARPSEESLLACLERLAGDGELAQRVGAAGRAIVAERYSWSRSAGLLNEALQAATGGG
jgi:glycosyltransferase involved in cell wall biosynthesis